MKIFVLGTGHLADATRGVLTRRQVAIVDYKDDPDILWCCIDTPVDDYDEPNVGAVLDELSDALGEVDTGVLVLVSSQVPVGTLALLESMYPDRYFATQPENIRKAHAVEDMTLQNRIVVGTRHDEDKPLLTELFLHFTPEPRNILFMSPESAEMTKHVLNTFLALEITYVNEVASLCANVGADVDDVIHGFRTDRRVGHGPLIPGGAYRGGTLGRDVVVLGRYSPGPVISSIKKSNDVLLLIEDMLAKE